MALMNTGHVVVEVLKAEGVKFVFGLPGGHTLHIYDGLCKSPEIRHILVRHEQTAANMAAAHASLTGEPGSAARRQVLGRLISYQASPRPSTGPCP